MVTEFCHLGSLEGQLQLRRNENILPHLRRPFSEVLVKMLLSDISHGLMCLARNKFIHGDLKPHNIFISKICTINGTTDFRFRIGDFGCCRKFSAPVEAFSGIIGTQLFLSPELKRAENRLIGSFVDYYALGLIIYDMCAIDSSPGRKTRVFENGDLSYFRIHECYSADLRNWILRLLDPDYTKRPTPDETVA